MIPHQILKSDGFYHRVSIPIEVDGKRIENEMIVNCSAADLDRKIQEARDYFIWRAQLK